MTYTANFGTGTLGDVTNPSGQINSYANVITISADGKTLTIGTTSNGIYEQFTVGTEIMFHVTGSTSQTTYIGNYCFAKISSVSGSNITIDKDINAIFPVSSISSYICQIVTVAQFRN